MIYHNLSTNLPNYILGDTLNQATGGPWSDYQASYGSAWKANIYKGTMPTIANFEANWETHYKGGPIVIGSELVMIYTTSVEHNSSMKLYNGTNIYHDTSYPPTAVAVGDYSTGMALPATPMTWAVLFPGDGISSPGPENANWSGYPLIGYGFEPSSNWSAWTPFSANGTQSYMLVPVSDAAGDGVIKLSTVDPRTMTSSTSDTAFTPVVPGTSAPTMVSMTLTIGEA